MDIATRIAAGRRRLELNQTAFAERLGVSRGAVHLWETGRGAPTRKHATALATLLGMNVEKLMPIPKKRKASITNVPVLRTVADGGVTLPWLFRVTGEVVDMVNAPQPLRHRKDLRAMQVPTDHMAPRYFEGEMIWMSQARLPVDGDFIVIMRINHDASDRSEHATLGRLVKSTAAHVEIEQYKPARRYPIPRRQISSIWRIIPASEFV